MKRKVTQKKFAAVAILLFGCNSYNDQMNKLLSTKKEIEVRIDSNHSRDIRFRDITGYSEMDDSLVIGMKYPNPELIDSIHFMKQENEYLKSELIKIQYSIDSLQKLR